MTTRTSPEQSVRTWVVFVYRQPEATNPQLRGRPPSTPRPRLWRCPHPSHRHLNTHATPKHTSLSSAAAFQQTTAPTASVPPESALEHTHGSWHNQCRHNFLCWNIQMSQSDLSLPKLWRCTAAELHFRRRTDPQSAEDSRNKPTQKYLSVIKIVFPEGQQRHVFSNVNRQHDVNCFSQI